MGRFAKAAEEWQHAADYHKAAAGAHMGISSTHSKEADRGSPGASKDVASQAYKNAENSRAFAGAAAQHASDNLAKANQSVASA